MKLHQLSNGNWIDLATVTDIVKLERIIAKCGDQIRPSCVVIYAPPFKEIVACDDEQQAEEMRDGLAALVNGLRL